MSPAFAVNLRSCTARGSSLGLFTLRLLSDKMGLLYKYLACTMTTALRYSAGKAVCLSENVTRERRHEPLRIILWNYYLAPTEDDITKAISPAFQVMETVGAIASGSVAAFCYCWSVPMHFIVLERARFRANTSLAAGEYLPPGSRYS